MKKQEAKSQITILEAEPGWYVVVPLTDDGKVIRLFRDRILAWRVYAEQPVPGEGRPSCDVTPLTVSGDAGGYNVICDPSGQMHAPGITVFDSEEAVIEFLQDECDCIDSPCPRPMSVR